MSNLSAALNSLASTTIMDFYKPITTRLTGHPRPEEHYLRLARWATIAWGVVLFLVGLVARNWGSVLSAGLSIASILYGALLGVFLLGILTRRTSETGAIAGMVASLAMMFYVKNFTVHRLDLVCVDRYRDHNGRRIFCILCISQRSRFRHTSLPRKTNE